MIETITPRDENHWLEMRKTVLTSTNIAALFGLSPYQTLYELWHVKHNNFETEFVSNERVEWGNKLEAPIAEMALERLGCDGGPMKDFLIDKELKLGSSFDYWFEKDEKKGILEIKNVDGLVFMQKWGKNEEGELVPPYHILLQVHFQMLVSGLGSAKIAALVGGNTLHIIDVVKDYNIQDKILAKCSEFWTMPEPTPDYVADHDFLMSLPKYTIVDKKKIVPLTVEMEELAMNYLMAGDAKKEADNKQKECKSKMLVSLGNTGKAFNDYVSVSSSVTKYGKRSMRVTKRVKK